MQRTIEVGLKLTDRLTGSLKSVVQSATRELNQLQKKMDGVGSNSPTRSSGLGSSSGGNGSLVGSIAAGNLLASGIETIASGVVSAGSRLVGALNSAYQDAAEANRNQLSSTSANAALLGIGFDESAKMTSEISKQLAQSAIKLPGATRDYLDAFNGVSDTLTQSKGLTAKGLTDAGREMVELTAMLGRASGAGSGVTSTVLGKMLGDTGSEALFRIDAFEKVPAFKAILEKDLQKAGRTLDDFFKMDAAAKQDQLIKVKKQLFSDDYVEKMNESMDAQIDTLSSQLFDPTSGVFGFLRDIKVGGIDTTVFKELGKTFKALSESAQTLFGMVFGGSGDPMVSLASSLIQLRKWAEGTGNFLRGFTSSSNPLENMGTVLISRIQSFVMGGVDQMGQLIQSGGLGELGHQIGANLASSISTGMQMVSQFVIANFPAISSGIMAAFFGLAQLLNGVIGGIAQEAPNLIGSALTLGFTMLAAGLGVVLSALTGMVGFMIQDIISSVRQGFGMVKSAVGSAFSSAIQSAMNLGEAIRSGLLDIANSIRSAISSALSNLSSLATQVTQPGSTAGNQPISVMGGSRWLGQNLGLVGVAYDGNLMGAIGAEMRNKPSDSHLVIANSSELIVPRDRIGDLNSSINITINAKRDEIVGQVSRALDTVLRQPTLRTSS